MRSVKTVLTFALLSIVVLVLSGTAFAISTPTTPSVTVNTIQANGLYTGQPVVLNSYSETYGYNYTNLVSDGTYTVFGTITNKDTQSHDALIQAMSIGQPSSVMVTVPANSTVSFQITLAAPSANSISVVATSNGNTLSVDTSDVQYTNAPDAVDHTFSEGAMSDMVIVFNGTPTEQYLGTARPTLNNSYLFLAQVYDSIWI